MCMEHFTLTFEKSRYLHDGYRIKLLNGINVIFLTVTNDYGCYEYTLYDGCMKTTTCSYKAMRKIAYLCLSAADAKAEKETMDYRQSMKQADKRKYPGFRYRKIGNGATIFTSWQH